MKKIIWKVIKIAGLGYLGFNSFAYERAERLTRMLDGYSIALGEETFTSSIRNLGFRDGVNAEACLMVVLWHCKWNVNKAFSMIVEERTNSAQDNDEES